MNHNDVERYRKQILLEKIGEDGQRRLGESKVLVAGCGALGTVICNNLVRMGVGTLVIADRDFIERDNLHRQILFDEDDVAANLPKAIAAENKLRKINPSVKIEALVTDINSKNIKEMMSGVNCVIDGTDNFETRYLINDACYSLNIPWIYGGVTGTSGMFYAFVPGKTPCLRCLMNEPPAPGETETCDTVGVLPTAVSVAASMETTEAVKILTGRGSELIGKMVRFNAWDGLWVSFGLKKDDNCPLCVQGRYDFLDSRLMSKTVSLCGRNAMQINPAKKTELDFAALSARLASSGSVDYNEYMLKFSAGDIEISVFKDSRAIIKGVNDEAAAKSAFSKYIGL
ncbi:MAG: ThiF family adenylyltransferase [Spirochaetia bacterium]|jgi:adenylyltransferase/sulfurtransferase|nr:ThiF family adenylyltransferase [Spirochaetia bacterium]